MLPLQVRCSRLPNNHMTPDLDLMRHVLEHGSAKTDRTGTGTRSVFGWQMRFDLGKGFPLLTTKKLHLRSIIHELLWFLQGDSNIRYLKENKVSIWDEWADADGNLGPIYGYQWRHWTTPDGREIDQIAQLVASDEERHARKAVDPRPGLAEGGQEANNRRRDEDARGEGGGAF